MWPVIQVCSSDVVYDSVPNGCQGLELAVKLHIYPPAIHCVVMYTLPPNCYQGSIVKMNSLNIEGTDMAQLSFPFKVYERNRKWFTAAEDILNAWGLACNELVHVLPYFCSCVHNSYSICIHWQVFQCFIHVCMTIFLYLHSVSNLKAGGCSLEMRLVLVGHQSSIC